MSQPPPRCYVLTPHAPHSVPGDIDFGDAACPGVPNLAEPAAQQPLSRGERLRRNHAAQRIGRVLASLPEEVYLQLDAGYLEQACAEAAAAVYERAIAAGDARVRAEYDEATQELAAELADERTLHQQTIRELETMREVARGNKRHVKYLTEECERLTAEVARVRVDERRRVAEEIAAELAEWATRQRAQAKAAWNPQAIRDLEAYGRAYDTAAGIVRRHASAPAERVQGGSTDTTGTPDPQRYWWHHDGPAPTDNSGLVCAPTPGTADKPRSSGCVGCGCMTTVKWRRGEPITAGSVPSLPEETPAGGIE